MLVLVKELEVLPVTLAASRGCGQQLGCRMPPGPFPSLHPHPAYLSARVRRGRNGPLVCDEDEREACFVFTCI